MTRILWYLKEITSRLWVSALFYGASAIFTIVLAFYLKGYVPEGWSEQIGANSVDSILAILASSMLSVTIFSLTTMVAAYSSVTSNVTPRATRLLIEDKLTHRALSTFLGAFIFSIVGIVALKTGVYGDGGRFVLFIATILLIALIVITLLSWVEYLTRLGRVGETVVRVERESVRALENRLRKPYLGGAPLLNDKDIPKKSAVVMSGTVGYVQHIDMPSLSGLAEKHELKIYVTALPGTFLDHHTSLASVSGACDAETLSEVSKAFIIDDNRSFRQDPRFGVQVLHEISSRALSPAVNDPGTAIQVIGVMIRVLSVWAKREELADAQDEILYPRIYVQPLKAEDLLDDFFNPVARDGAAFLEVCVMLKKAYKALTDIGDKELSKAAAKHADILLKRAEASLALDDDFKYLKSLP